MPSCASLAVPCAVPRTRPGAPCSPRQGTAVFPAPKGYSCSSSSAAEPTAWVQVSLAAARTICTSTAAFRWAVCLGDAPVSTLGDPHLGQWRGSGLTNKLGAGAMHLPEPWHAWKRELPEKPRVEWSSSFWLTVQALGEALLLLLSLDSAASHGCVRVATWGVST